LKDISDNVQHTLFTPKALKATPTGKRQKDTELTTLEGLFKCFPPEGDVQNIPSEKTRFASNAEELIVQANRNVRNNIVNFLLEIMECCAWIMHPRTAFTYIMEVTATKIWEKWNQNFSKNSTKRERSLEKMANSMFAVATASPPTSTAACITQAVIVTACSQKNLDDNFYEYGPPTYGQKARKNGKADHSRKVAEGKTPLIIKQKLARVADDIVFYNVGTLPSYVEFSNRDESSFRFPDHHPLPVQVLVR
jgi:hypothetical protein